MSCLSARSRPSIGSGSSAEPPPETKAITRSSAVSRDTRSSIRLAAFNPAASGTGCAASTISMRSHGLTVPCARDDEAGERAGPSRFERPRHRRRSLAGAHDHEATLGRARANIWKVRRTAERRRLRRQTSRAARRGFLDRPWHPFPCSSVGAEPQTFLAPCRAEITAPRAKKKPNRRASRRSAKCPDAPATAWASTTKPLAVEPSAKLSVPMPSGAGIAATNAPKLAASSDQISASIAAPSPSRDARAGRVSAAWCWPAHRGGSRASSRPCARRRRRVQSARD